MNEITRQLLPILQMNLADKVRQANKALTAEDIAESVNSFIALPMFASAEKDILIDALEKIFTIWSDTPGILINNNNHVSWLSSKEHEIDWRFWNRYKLFLTKDKKLSPAALDTIDKVSRHVLDSIEDPNRDGPWDRRGLVMGNVQSGKTGAYTGLICKAADAGYKVIIVLAGLHNNLRSQTQIRLDEGFLGYKADSRNSAGIEHIGVSAYGRVQANSVTDRSENGDFNSRVARQFQIHPGGLPLLFVVKKNKSVLTNLLSWIEGFANAENSETGEKIHKNIPLLLVDDESDQASVDVKAVSKDENFDSDDEHNPSIINGLIRRLLLKFDKSAYVGFTATPFANIFINDDVVSKKYGPDLYPESFIINLPSPSNYVGAAQVFGIDDELDVGLDVIEALPIVKFVDDYVDDPQGDPNVGWMPPKLVLRTEHVPLYKGENVVPPSLREAILSFILSSTIRTKREGSNIFNSMLVHVTRYANVQKYVADQVQIALNHICNSLEYGDGQSEPTLLQELHFLYSKNYKVVTTALGADYDLPVWEDLAPNFLKVAKSIKLLQVNGTVGDVLEYEENVKNGLNVIAIGGDKLSRGLTLEGLTVSYFIRSSRMYDTLMQMGRWFGYKEKYLDVCRLYTIPELYDWFKHIAEASEELRKEFNYMNEIRETPASYGLKVRSHSAMMITSAIKMRNATNMKLSYAGQVSETVSFDNSPRSLDKNIMAVNKLIADLKGDSTYSQRSSAHLWTHVSSKKILDFLDVYEAHPESIRSNTKLLRNYIQTQVNQNELKNWTVYIPSISISAEQEVGDMRKVSNDVSQYFDNLKIGAVYRKNISDIKNTNKFTIKRMISPSDEAIDLSKKEFDSALIKTIEAWTNSMRKNKSPNEPTVPSGLAARASRDKSKALLLLYPINNIDVNSSVQVNPPYIGMAISFPASDTAHEISYQVTNIYSKSEGWSDE